MIAFDDQTNPIILDAQHIHENDGPQALTRVLKKGKRFKGSLFLSSLSGGNRTPFPSVVYPSSLLSDAFQLAGEDITLFEDHLLFLWAMARQPVSPWLLGQIGVYISIHGNRQSVVSDLQDSWVSRTALILQLTSPATMPNRELWIAARHWQQRKIPRLRTLLKVAGLALNPRAWRSVRAFKSIDNTIKGRTSFQSLISQVRDFS